MLRFLVAILPEIFSFFGRVYMEKTIIYIVRHGESMGNATKCMLGHTDLDLSAHGYKQAECTAEFLKDVKLDFIYSSDLLRAYNTAKAHADIRNVQVIPEKKLRELYVGLWEGLHVSDIIEGWGNTFKDDWHGGFGTFVFPEGEAVMDGGRRFYEAVLDIAKRHRGKTVLVAAHAAVIRAFWSIISKIAPENIVNELPFPTNASYSICELSGDTLIPVEYSCDKHLVEIGITGVIPPK